MRESEAPLRILGANKPLFKAPIPVGQLYKPQWEQYCNAMSGIFERAYYNNNGPLLNELEEKIANFIGVKHAICTSNATLGLMIALDAMNLKGKVIVPAFTFVASVQAVEWNNLEPVLCDIEPNSQHIDIEHLKTLITDDVSAIMAVNLWGNVCNIIELERIAEEHNIKLIMDSAQAFAAEIDNRKVGQFGDCEVFSFHATKIINATEGGCICTNNDVLAGKMRAIRPTYPANPNIEVERVINARMSEAQAAMALLSFNQLQANLSKNRLLFNVYNDELRDVAGIRSINSSSNVKPNFQSFTFRVDEKEFGLNRDQLQRVLVEENILARRYFYPGLHSYLNYSSSTLENAVVACRESIQLPIGDLVDEKSAYQICQVIKLAQQLSRSIKEVL